jgi:hypothetical protein
MNVKSPLNKTLSSGNKKFNAQFNIFKWYKDINELT